VLEYFKINQRRHDTGDGKVDLVMDLFKVAVSGFHHEQHNQNQFRFRRSSFYSQFKSKVDNNILVKVTVLYINLNIDGDPLVSRTHPHPSHLQTSHLRSPQS